MNQSTKMMDGSGSGAGEELVDGNGGELKGSGNTWIPCGRQYNYE